MQQVQLLRQFGVLQKRLFVLVLSLECLGSALTLLLPLLVAQAFAEVFEFQSMRGRLLQKMGAVLPFPIPFLLGLALVIVLKLGLDFYRRKLKGRLLERFLSWLRQKLFTHHLRMDVREYERAGTSKYLLRFSGDLSSAQQLLSKGVLQFVADASLLLLGTGLMLYLHVQLGLLVLGLGIIAALILTRFNRKIEALESQRRDRKAGLLSFVNQRLSHIYSIKALNRERPELARFERRAGKIQTLGELYQKQAAWLNALIPFFIYTLLVLVLGVAYWGKHRGMPMGQDVLFAFILLLLTWKPVLQRVLQTGLVWKKGGISLRKIQVLLDKPLEASATDQAQNWRASSLKIQLQSHLSSSTNILELAPGTKLELSLDEAMQGKLLKKLAALEIPDPDQIWLDEYSIQDLVPKSVRRQFAFVSPLFPLYGKNVLEAIAYSRKHEDKARQNYAEWQQLFPELAGLALDTPVTERHLLTTSQQQLLQWLRAALTRKPFLIVQDATRYLPAETVAQLMELVQKQKQPSGILYLSDEKFSKKIHSVQVTFSTKHDM